MARGNFVILEDRGVLAVSGADRRSFLQGLVSNDVEKLAPDRALYAALLTAQGKYLHDFIMALEGEAIWFDAEAARLADLRRRLSIYRLRAKVALDERPELAVAAVFGDGELAAVGLSGEPGTARQIEAGIVLVDPRLAELGARAILPRDSVTTGAPSAGQRQAAHARILLSQPSLISLQHALPLVYHRAPRRFLLLGMVFEDHLDRTLRG
jgi:folate-binding Fe-S cluster repair protein YgfZ